MLFHSCIRASRSSYKVSGGFKPFRTRRPSSSLKNELIKKLLTVIWTQHVTEMKLLLLLYCLFYVGIVLITSFNMIMLAVTSLSFKQNLDSSEKKMFYHVLRFHLSQVRPHCSRAALWRCFNVEPFKGRRARRPHWCNLLRTFWSEIRTLVLPGVSLAMCTVVT
jgi:hypothetical protein